MNNILIVVDMQRDFCPPDGSLAVPQGDKIVSKVNEYIDLFLEAEEDVIYTRDWHPSNHISFASQHKSKKPFTKVKIGKTKLDLWPDHCVQGTFGADFHPELKVRGTIFSKGMRPDREEYSALGLETPLDHYLYGRSSGISDHRAFVCGLATDYCVRAHVLGLLADPVYSLRKVHVLSDAISGVSEATTQEAIDEMKEAGAVFTTFSKTKKIISGAKVGSS